MLQKFTLYNRNYCYKCVSLTYFALYSNLQKLTKFSISLLISILYMYN